MDVKAHLEPINFGEFKKKINWEGDEIDYSSEEAIKIGIDNFWDEIRKRSKNNHKEKPLYYAADLPITFYPDDLDVWNLNKFTAKDSVIHKMPKKDWLPGIHQSLVFVGMKNSCFGMHGEDRYLGAVSYNFWGAPKFWYGLHRKHEKDIIKFANGTIENNYCDNLLYHKCLLMSPNVLEEAKFEFSMVRNFFFALFFAFLSFTIIKFVFSL